MGEQLRDFQSSRFFVAVYGEGVADTAVVDGYEGVLSYLDKVMDDGSECTFHSPCAEIHDEDNWHHAHGMVAGDCRFRYHESVGETGTIEVFRLFEYPNEPV